jgi:hypothetical protein
VANLFTSQTPDITNASDGTPGITTATTEVFAVDGTVPGIWFYATTTVGGTYVGTLWTVDSSDPGVGTVVDTKTLAGSPVPGAWNLISFDTPAAVTGMTVAYRAAVFSSDGRYVATLNFFPGGGGGLTNGDAFAPPNNDNPVGAITINQGTFRINASDGYPNSNGSGTCYFVAADFVPGSAGATGSGALTLPAVTAAGTGVASASGSGALTLPAVTATGAGTASASGAGAPELPALTASGTGTATATGSGALTLPAVTASGFGGEPADEVSAPGPVIRTSARDRTLRTSTWGG